MDGPPAGRLARTRALLVEDRDLRGGMIFAAGLAVTALLALVSLAYLGRRLSPSDFATYGAFLGAFLALSSPNTALFGGAAMVSAARGEILQPRWRGAIAGMGAILGLGALLPFPSTLRTGLLFGAAAAVWMLMSWNRGLLIGLGRLSAVAGTMVWEGVARVGFTILLVSVGWRIAGATGGLVLGMAAALVVTESILPRRTGRESGPIPAEVRVSIVGLLFLGLMQFADVTAVRLAGSSGSAAYTAASSLARVALYAQGPAAAYALRRAGVSDPRRALGRALAFGILLGGSVTVLLEVFPRAILTAAYGHRYASAVSLVRILGVAMILSGAALVLVQWMMGVGESRWAWPVAASTVLGIAGIAAVASRTTSAAEAMLAAQALILAGAAASAGRVLRARRTESERRPPIVEAPTPAV